MANLTQTTLAAPLTANGTMINVASATGISGPTGTAAPQKLYIIDPAQVKGELVTVAGPPNGTMIPITRGAEYVSAHVTGAIVLIAPVDPTQGGFYEYDPFGPAPASPITLPWVNVTNGRQFLPSLKGLWVAGWNNMDVPDDTTAAVASAAGLVTPSGPLFHITGALAITGFNVPVGFAGGSFTVIPDGTFTWTTANNIAVAGTAVVSRLITFTMDNNSGKFYPQILA